MLTAPASLHTTCSADMTWPPTCCTQHISSPSNCCTCLPHCPSVLLLVTPPLAKHAHTNTSDIAKAMTNVTSAAGAVQTAISCPVELLKIRLQLQTVLPGSPGYIGPWGMLRHVLTTEGVCGAAGGHQAPAGQAVHRWLRAGGQPSFEGQSCFCAAETLLHRLHQLSLLVLVTSSLPPPSNTHTHSMVLQHHTAAARSCPHSCPQGCSGALA